MSEKCLYWLNVKLLYRRPKSPWTRAASVLCIRANYLRGFSSMNPLKPSGHRQFNIHKFNVLPT